jgi:alpha-D-xyloside xylohydrolase
MARGRISRRGFLLATAGGIAVPSWSARAPKAANPPDFVAWLPDGVLELTGLSDRAFRVRFVPSARRGASADSPVLQPSGSRPAVVKSVRGGTTRLDLPFIRCEIDAKATLRFFDRAGRLLLAEVPGARRLAPARLYDEQVFEAEQAFESPADEHLYGTGCFQDGQLNLRALPRRLTQVNTQISQPFLLSSRGYGLLWHNLGMSELNMPDRRLTLEKGKAGDAHVSDVTTARGNAQVARRTASFEGKIVVEQGGRYGFLLDIGRKMASRHYVEIDGKPCVDFANLWLPPTAGFFADLAPGTHHVRVEANDADAPSLLFGPAQPRTVWRSPVADAIDYIVIAGPGADEVMAGYRDLIGPTPMMPRWAYGYIHCRERFHSSDEIIDTLSEFRRRRLPVDVMVQDWQYWGKYGWNAMRFDELHYPDPAALTGRLHAMGARFMLSVWAKIGRETELGKEAARGGFYIPDTEWIDFFNPQARAFYCGNQDVRLGKLGIDAWWQDATEPENDDLVGRMTAAGRGEHVRLLYPLVVAKAVYEERRRAEPDKRVMILTRCAFPGQQRYGAATWSGDIGNDWGTLGRQISAGLNMAAAGYPYWTVDAGGFFRPGEGQYRDPAYRERLLRWFQYATFLPLQRVHGYQTDTEFWRFGEQVESIARAYLELRYRLHPYIYSLAGETTRKGTPLMRPLLFDFPDDERALDERHSYLFGRALHVAPVLAEGVADWPVYLPRSAGGWYDFWTGERREGGREHRVPAPIEHVPLHVRAGSILPFGPVMQSTVEASGIDVALHVFPGRDGAFDLYEDDGLSNAYERGAASLIPVRWDDRRRELSIGARHGEFPGMLAARTFTVRLAGRGGVLTDDGAGQRIAYSGRAVRLRLA